MMTELEARAWRPEIPGWSDDILGYYQDISKVLVKGARIVEIGVYHGRSITFMCDQLEDRPDVEVFGVDISQQSTKIPDRVQFILSESDAAANMFPDKSVDFVFIDACHEYEYVYADIKSWLPKVKKGGILSGHDYHPDGSPGVVKAVDEIFGKVNHPTRTVWEFRV